MTRRRPLIHLTLSPEAIERLAEIATRRGETRSAVVEKWIRDAEMPRSKTAGKTVFRNNPTDGLGDEETEK